MSKVANSVLNSIVNEGECFSEGSKICSEYGDHNIKQSIARFEYTNDKNLYEPSNGEVMAAVVMQKVIVLPRMPGVKKAIFTKRLRLHFI